MSTSGTYTFAPTLATVIDEAWERCGFDPAKLDVRTLVSAQRSLNLILRSELSADAINLWKVAEHTATPAEGDDDLSLPTGAIDVLEASTRDSDGIETPMIPISRADWRDIPDKSISGRPDRYWVERTTGTKTLHFWPAMGSPAHTLVLNVMFGVQDAGDLHNEADLPDLWQEAICAVLAHKLALKFAPDRIGMLEPLAASAYRLAKISDRERAPLILTASYGRRW